VPIPGAAAAPTATGAAATSLLREG
jgi:hypothetical protein